MLVAALGEHIFCLCTRLEVGNGLGYERLAGGIFPLLLRLLHERQRTAKVDLRGGEDEMSRLPRAHPTIHCAAILSQTGRKSDLCAQHQREQRHIHRGEGPVERVPSDAPNGRGQPAAHDEHVRYNGARSSDRALKVARDLRVARRTGTGTPSDGGAERTCTPRPSASISA